MPFKKIDDVGRNPEISEEEMKHGEIPTDVELSDAELHNPDEVEKDAQVDDKDEETKNDYLLARYRSEESSNYLRDLVMKIS